MSRRGPKPKVRTLAMGKINSLAVCLLILSIRRATPMAATGAAPYPKLSLLPASHPSPQSSFSSSRFPSSSFFSSSVATAFSLSHSYASLSALPLPLFTRLKRAPRVLAVAEEEAKTATPDEQEADPEAGLSEETKLKPRPCELYVCNLPRSCDISQLLNLFKPFGTVNSVEVSRDAETGVSKGCGFVTMSSISEAKAAIAVLDGSDLGGRELRVKFSADMVSGRENIGALTTTPKKNIVFESPHKIYVGNLAWSVRPKDLREYFCQFGAVVSTRVLYDRKGGKNRVYGFISFSTAEELNAAIETNGSEYRGRTIVVREVINME